MTNDQTGAPRRGRRAGAFDIRTFIALLLGLYGVILLVTSFVSTSDADLAKADGVNVNLWVGLGLVAAAGFFQTWATLRPLVVPPEAQHDDGSPRSG